jgi:hypothetical protein
MKITKKITAVVVFISLVFSCSSADENLEEGGDNVCNTKCVYTITSAETKATIPKSIFGTYDLKYTYEESNSPFKNNQTGRFVISNNTLTVSISGESCITITNPVARGKDNYLFKDTCRDNITYNVSANTDGTFAEVNIEPIGQGFFGQFK